MDALEVSLERRVGPHLHAAQVARVGVRVRKMLGLHMVSRL